MRKFLGGEMSFIEFPQSGNEDKEEGNFFDLRYSERTTSRRQGKIFGRQKEVVTWQDGTLADREIFLEEPFM